MIVKFGVLIFAISIQSFGQAQEGNVVEVATGYRVKCHAWSKQGGND
jgi:hypothetical protein